MNIKDKRVLILGANPETAGLVQKCNEMGLVTYVTDNNPLAFAKKFAAHPLNIDATNIRELKNVIVDSKIDGIICGVAESLLPTYANLCLTFDKPCFGNNELFNIFVDKSKFKEICRKHNVLVVDEFFPRDYSDKELEKVKLPVVVKPVDSCSSKGISVCRTIDQLKEAISKALSFSKSKKIIIEKFMTGDEVILYYAFQNGEASLVGMCDRYTNNEQVGFAQLPTAYIFPSIHLKKYIEKGDKNLKEMFKNIGVKNGFMFIQSFIDEDGNVRFYEPGYRLNGAQEHYIINKATGIDAKECLINLALFGEEARYSISDRADPFLNGKYGCKLSPLIKPGTIGKIKGLETIAKMKDVVSINPSYDVGDVVEGKGTLKQIVCRFFIVSDSIFQLKKTIDSIYELFDVFDETGKSLLMRQFDTNILLERYDKNAK